MIFVTGEQHTGKTGMILELAQKSQAEGLHVAGIACPGLWDQGHRAGFDLLELDTGHRHVLSRRIQGLRPMPYMFDAEGLRRGGKALSVSRCRKADLVIVDEVGPWELDGGGWAACLSPLLSLDHPVHIWVIRRSLVQTAQDHFQVRGHVVDVNAPNCLAQLLARI